jgi:hypothetical protein
MSRLAATPVKPRTMRRGSDLWRPKVAQHDSSPKMRIWGTPIVRVVTAYQDLRDEHLATLPGMQRLTSTMVMKRVVDQRPFPLSPRSAQSKERWH